MAQKFWIGIDGGGTKTTAVIGDENGQLLAIVKGSSGNLTAISLEQLATLLTGLIEQLLQKAAVKLSNVETIFAAMAGADRPEEQQKIYEAFHQLPLKNIKVQSDIHAALAAGTWGREGTLIIAGTGAILFGYQHEKTFRIGGWGYLLGDEGSGYHLGKLAIRSILNAHDNQLELRTFQHAILAHFHVQSPTELITKIYSSLNPVTAISSVSRLVLAAYEEDSVAKVIVKEVQQALVELIDSAATKMDVTKPIVLHGGLFSNSLFYEAFKKRIAVKFPELVVLKPSLPGAVGAYLLALHENGINVSEQVKRRIQQSWHLLEGELE